MLYYQQPHCSASNAQRLVRLTKSLLRPPLTLGHTVPHHINSPGSTVLISLIFLTSYPTYRPSRHSATLDFAHRLPTHLTVGEHKQKRAVSLIHGPMNKTVLLLAHGSYLAIEESSMTGSEARVQSRLVYMVTLYVPVSAAGPPLFPGPPEIGTMEYSPFPSLSFIHRESDSSGGPRLSTSFHSSDAVASSRNRIFFFLTISTNMATAGRSGASSTGTIP
mmetsp:Transcript_18459/g.22141  ORF Transcript_18459/g.22141 Transcript_18459/m.22141 type:complete len:220 (-) Transcript_18459:1991-2650(-)